MNKNDHQRENALMFYQILSTHFAIKCIEISLENFYVYQLGLKGLRGLCHEDIASFKVNSVLKSLLSIFFQTQNPPVELWRRYQTNATRDHNNFWRFLQAQH